MEFAGATLDELDAVVFYDKPLLKLERLLESYHNEEAAILTIDGVGEWATTVVGKGSGKEILCIKEVRFPHSLGLLYSAATYYCGFKVNSGEYKLMGLAPYGDEQSPQFLAFKEKITSHLVTIYEDGSFFLHQEYFKYLKGLRMTNDKKWLALFGFPRREPESPLEQQHCNLALAFQKVTEEIVLKLAVTTRELTGMRRLCLAGGVALNCVANGKLLDAGIFDEVWVQPAAGSGKHLVGSPGPGESC